MSTCSLHDSYLHSVQLRSAAASVPRFTFKPVVARIAAGIVTGTVSFVHNISLSTAGANALRTAHHKLTQVVLQVMTSCTASHDKLYRKA
jgi:hypothetical protein